MLQKLTLEYSNFKTRHLNQAGFTLIEVLISITILTFIAMSTYIMVDKNVTTKETVLTEDSDYLQLLTALNRIDGDFTQFYSPLFYSQRNTNQNKNRNVYEDNNHHKNEYFDGLTETGDIIPKIISEDKNTLTFFTQANRRRFSDSRESRFMWVKYKLISMEADPDDPDKNVSGRYALIRQVIADDIYDPNHDWSDAKEQVLLENIKELSFSFWDVRNKKFTTTLNELNENKLSPRMMKTAITWFDVSGQEKVVEKVSRVLQPFFDINLDKEQLKKAQAKGGQAQSQGQNQTSDNLPSSEDAGDEE